MKKFAFLLCISLALFACKKENGTDPVNPGSDTTVVKNTVITFEDAKLDSAGVLNNTPYVCGDVTFSNLYDNTYASWEGFAISNNTDTETAEWSNQYSVITGAAHAGSKFAVAYQGYSSPTQISCSKDFKPQRLFLTNSTYAYQVIKNGNAYSTAFADGDYFTVSFTGLSALGDTTGIVTFYLADYRDGKSFILNSWQEVSLAALGTCRSIVLSFNSTDTGDYGINTPCYAIIDDFEYKY